MGARVVTTLSGSVTAVVGISPSTINVTMTVPQTRAGHGTSVSVTQDEEGGDSIRNRVLRVSLAPNVEFDITSAKVVRSSPFTPPFD